MAELNSEFKLFTTLGFTAEKSSVEPLLGEARGAAFSRNHTEITLDANGNGVADSTVNGVAQSQHTVSFSELDRGLGGLLKGHPTENYTAKLDPGTSGELNASLKLGMGLISGKTDFHIKADAGPARQIDGTCSSKDGATVCDETVKDADGRTILLAKTTTDLGKTKDGFTRQTDFLSPETGKLLAHLDQKVAISANRLVSDTTVSKPEG